MGSRISSHTFSEPSPAARARVPPGLGRGEPAALQIGHVHHADGCSAASGAIVAGPDVREARIALVILVTRTELGPFLFLSADGSAVGRLCACVKIEVMLGLGSMV